MKVFLGILCSTLLLGVYSCTPISSAEDTRKPVDLESICVQITNPRSRTDKAPIILLHGTFGFKEMWFGLMPFLALKTGRKVCAPDLRNHGDSPWSEDFDTIVMAKDVERLLETHKMEKVIILGHSLGGKTAVQFTLNNPEKVEKLIVEDMRPNGLINDPNVTDMLQVKDLAEAALKAIPEGATEIEARRAVYRFFKETFKKINEAFELDDIVVDHYPIKCSNGKCSWKSNVERISKAVLDVKSLIPDSHGHFNNPSLFIYGTKSPLRVWDVKDEILEMFPKAEFVGIEGAGHNVNDFPEYKHEILKFILK